MALNFCLPKDRVESFISGLKSGEIDPTKLTDMTSKQRRELFSKFVGEDGAKRVNAEFEAKTLLKDQQQGFINWAKNVTGITPQVRRTLIDRIKKMDKVLEPNEKGDFLEELASMRLGADVTSEEIQNVAKFSKSLKEAESKMREDYTFPSTKDRLDYGRALVKMEDYVSELKNNTKKMRLSDVKRNPVVAAGKGVSNAAGLAKSITASLDSSVIGRQGLKVLLTHPKTWLKNSKQSFIDMARTYGGKNVMEEVRAEIYSRPNALNGLYRREKLALGNAEEAYPTSLPEKIPIAGRAFKASENAFTAFQYRTRADLMDQFAKVAEKTGADIKGMGIIANGLTGRGSYGKFEGPALDAANKLFFSPRFVKSNVDALTGHVLDYGKLGSMAKKEAAKNTVKIISGIAGVMALADAVMPGSVELDPRSSDFGKIKVGDTRFDISGGMSGLVTLAARMKTQSSKSTSGVVTKLNTGEYGSRSTLDVLLDFTGNKLSPAGQVVKDMMKGTDFNGNKVTPAGEISKLVVPIGIQNAKELNDDPNSANIIVAMLADSLGIGTNTYGPIKKESWKNSTSKSLEEFKNQVGEEKFKEANAKFDNEYTSYVNRVMKSDAYMSLSSDDKQSLLTKKKAILQKEVLKGYGFEYKAPKSDKNKFNDLLK